jgi:hypothetical protein
MAHVTLPVAGFTPPARYEFEPELHGPAPRPLPDALSRGPHLAQRRRGALALALFGGLCLLVSGIPLVRAAGLYFLPLAWASWIGVGSLALAGASWADLSLRAGRRRWVRDGSPLVAQVLELVKAPSAIVNGTPAQGRFTATVAFVYPETAVPAVAQLQSDDFSWDAREQYDTPFRVGDYVTALFLPGRFEKSLRLYTFLGLRAEHELRRELHRAKPNSPWAVAALLVGLAALFTGLVGGFIAYGLYEPIDFDYRRAAVPIAAGAILLGGALLASLWLLHRAQVRKSAEHNRRALESGGAIELATPFLGSGAHGWIVRIAVVLGAPLVGAALAVCWLFFANAWLDESAQRREPVQIENLVMTTHGLVFREYQIEYALSGSGARGKLLSTPEHMATLTSADGVALVRAGAFGWPWVEAIEAARPE